MSFFRAAVLALSFVGLLFLGSCVFISHKAVVTVQDAGDTVRNDANSYFKRLETEHANRPHRDRPAKSPTRPSDFTEPMTKFEDNLRDY